MEKDKDMENFFIVMEVYMKDIGKIIKKKGLEYLHSKIELNILGILRMIL